MDTVSPPAPQEQAELRQRFYNAEVIERIDVHDNLTRLRVRPDEPFPAFQPGQYVALGLGNWEPRLQPSQDERLPQNKLRKLVRRAYSISCPMIDDEGRLLTCADVDYLEFYITLVRYAGTDGGKPPALTPRLFMLRRGDRLCLEKKIVGRYVLENIAPEDTVLLLATGTGEAPHNAMVAQLLRSGHHGPIVLATTGRLLQDFAYREIHDVLSRQYPQLRVFRFTTREPHNLDPQHPKYVGKQYLQKLFASGKLAELSGVDLSPKSTHVFLCGNPAMIGYNPPGAAPLPEPGMLPLLTAAGFRQETDTAGVGSVRFEKYW